VRKKIEGERQAKKKEKGKDKKHKKEMATTWQHPPGSNRTPAGDPAAVKYDAATVQECPGRICEDSDYEPSVTIDRMADIIEDVQRDGGERGNKTYIAGW
jgi:hypothetical protein